MAEPEMDSGSIKSALLLEEIIEEILSRLPVKSLVRFRCVSKTWLSLISSERFIEAHRQNSTKNRAFLHHKIIFNFPRVVDGGGFKQCSLQQLLNEASSVEPFLMQQPTNDDVGLFVGGCCNGLLCLCFLRDLSERGLLLSLWNPTTMIFMELPNLKLDLLDVIPAKYGLGWDGKSGAYKVFVLSNRRGIRKGNVYSSKTNSWKTVDHGCPVFDDSAGVFVRGKINWVTTKGEDYDYIESFDLGSDEFGWIKLPFKTPPKTPPECRYKLAEIGGCLHLLCVHIPDEQSSYVVVVWVMKETGWLKLFTNTSLSISFSVIEGRLDLGFGLACLSILFGESPNEEIFLLIDGNLLVYNGKDVIVHPTSENIKYLNQGFVSVESLVSPKLTTAS